MDPQISRRGSRGSTYRGQRFTGGLDTLKGGFRSNPMLMGADEDHLTTVMKRVKSEELPSSFDIHKPISIVQNLRIDTTDSSTVRVARDHGFDTEGLRRGQPLRKDVFYTQPYVTCMNCNNVTFIDSMNLRQNMVNGPEDFQRLIAAEPLPPCYICLRTDMYAIGAHDFSKEVSERRRREAAMRRKRRGAARCIQRAYRAYFRRMYSGAFFKARVARNFLHHKAAVRINAAARGRLGRRRARTERWLLIIKHAHPILIDFALKPRPNDVGVFWYKQKSERDLLFADYMELLDRSGFIPPRCRVEENIATIGKRILDRQNYLITCVQRIWRGVAVRRFVKFFRYEVVRLRQWWMSRVQKIQRIFRGHTVRFLAIRKMKHDNRRNELMKQYRTERKQQREAKIEADKIELVKIAYRQERRDEATCRLACRIAPPSEYEGKKMKAFASSIYYDGRLDGLMGDILQIEYNKTDKKKQKDREVAERKAFLKERVAERGPDGFGFRRDKSRPPRTPIPALFNPRQQARESHTAGTTATTTDPGSALSPSSVDGTADVPPGVLGNSITGGEQGLASTLSEPPSTIVTKQAGGDTTDPSSSSSSSSLMPAAGAAPKNTTEKVTFALEKNTFGAHGFQKDAISKMVIFSLSKGASTSLSSNGGNGGGSTPSNGTRPSSRPGSRAGNVGWGQPSFHEGLYGANSSRSRGMSAFFEEEIRTITRTDIDRISHEHKIMNAAERFKEFNEWRGVDFKQQQQQQQQQQTTAAAVAVAPVIVNSIGRSRKDTPAGDTSRYDTTTIDYDDDYDDSVTDSGGLVASSDDAMTGTMTNISTSNSRSGGSSSRPSSKQKNNNSSTSTSSKKEKPASKLKQLMGGSNSSSSKGGNTNTAEKKPTTRSLRADYKYPDHIYHDPMAWLFEDYGKEHEEKLERENMQKQKEEQEQQALNKQRASYGLGSPPAKLGVRR